MASDATQHSVGLIAVASGEWILVGVVVLVTVGVAVGLFSRSGSEVDSHPRGSWRGGRDDTPEDDGELPGSAGRRFPSTRGTR